MDVVGHDAPGNQTVTLTVEILQGVLDEAGDLFFAEVATAFAGIGVSFDPLPQFHRLLGVGGESLMPVEFLFPLLDDGCGD